MPTGPHAIPPALSGGYIPSLDGLRAVSILLVLTSHAGLSKAIPGGFGVTVFFFLSGFLITALLTREWDRFGSLSFSAFYLRRVVRLGPPLVLTMLLAYALVLSGRIPGDLSASALLSQIFFFYNYFLLYVSDLSTADGLGILWSLSVEEQFYLIWPVMFLWIARGRIGPAHLLGMLALILMWRCLRFYGLGSSENEIYLSTDTRFDSLLYGCLLAILMCWRKPPAWVDRPATVYIALGLALGALAASFLIRDPGFRSTVRYSLQGLALMPVFYYAVTRPDHLLFRPLNWSLVRRLGLYSYTCYLVHFLLMHMLEGFGLQRGDPVVYIPLVTVLSFGWAALIHEIAEKPLKPLRARLTGHPASGETSPAQRSS